MGGIGEPVAPAFPGQVVTRVAANPEAVLRQAVRAEAVLGHIDGRVANGLLKEPLAVRIRRAEEEPALVEHAVLGIAGVHCASIELGDRAVAVIHRYVALRIPLNRLNVTRLAKR